ncbi:hypothetical protein INR49_005058 [Caranx melampygus]|nr:hypothetical protein INR49_005058 [Caranx melampygus]
MHDAILLLLSHVVVVVVVVVPLLPKHSTVSSRVSSYPGRQRSESPATVIQPTLGDVIRCQVKGRETSCREPHNTLKECEL